MNGSLILASVNLPLPPEELIWECVCVPSCFSHVWLFVTLWTITHQTPLSMEFSKQEYWSGLPCTSPGDLPSPGIEPASLTSPVLANGFFTTSATWEAPSIRKWNIRRNGRYSTGLLVQAWQGRCTKRGRKQYTPQGLPLPKFLKFEFLCVESRLGLPPWQ